jgi:DNA invertase Pin-like site-specific DNA recombinase
MNTNKRVYALYRVSTAGQVDIHQNDIPMQKNSCHEFAQRNGWTIVKEFSELGVSGYKKSANERDAIIQLRQAAGDSDAPAERTSLHAAQ